MRWMLILVVIGLVVSVASIPSWKIDAVQAKTHENIQVIPDVAGSSVDCLIAPQYPNGEVCIQTITFNEMEIAGSI